MSVTGPGGFRAAGVAAGVKPGGTLDLALLVADPGTVGTGVFTTNRAAAAPVLLSRAHLAADASFRAVVLNSGCANAATGPEGDAAAVAMAEATAMAVACRPSEVFVASTGTIGTRLPVMKVTAGIDAAAKRLATGTIADRTAATAIMTTDSVPKQAHAAADGVSVGGMAKGAGMVRPNMATMLAVLTTDAVVDPEVLDDVLREAVDTSFHALNIDGCPSTNDSVFLLASGASGVAPERGALGALIGSVCADLVEQLAADAEGASRVVTIAVSGAVDDVTARRAGMAVADSALVRSSFYGGDPNWGRIVGALGATALDYDPAAVAVSFEDVVVAVGGCGVGYDEAALLDLLAEGDFTVGLRLGDGPGSARVVTTDLTPEYVVFNAERS